MKKLLTTTALAAAFISGSAIAQTTVTGDLRIGYKAIETSAGSNHGANRGFGTESQINIQTKGKLNNGLEFAAVKQFTHFSKEILMLWILQEAVVKP